jgi:hypothetical protein
MEDQSNIFDRGALLQVESHCPGNVRKLRDAELEAIEGETFRSSAWIKVSGNGSSWLKGQKSLYDPTELKKVQRVKNAINSALDCLSLSFPIKGVKFIPIKNIPRAHEILEKGKVAYADAVSDFMDAWPERYAEAQDGLGQLFNPGDYPINILAKFGLDYQFLNLAAPNGAMRMIDPALYKEEAHKFKAAMERARNMAVECLRAEFKGMITSMLERLAPSADGTPKVFRDSLVGNFKDYFDEFQNRNVFEDDELSRLVDQARDALDGVDAGALRSDDGLREDIVKTMSGVNAEIQAAVKSRPKRRIKL